MLSNQIDIPSTLDEVADLFQLSTLNVEALDLITPDNLSPFGSLLQGARESYSQCENLRLQKLIRDQIYTEGDVERRDRLKDYEDRIQVQRRLVSDKETNYNNLHKKKSMKALYYSHHDYALVVSNNKKQERVAHTMSYEDQISSVHLLNLSYQQLLSQLRKEAHSLQTYKDMCRRINDNSCTGAFEEDQDQCIADGQLELVPERQKDEQEVMEIGSDEMVWKYTHRILEMKTSNNQLSQKLEAKKLFTGSLEVQNSQLTAKILGQRHPSPPQLVEIE